MYKTILVAMLILLSSVLASADSDKFYRPMKGKELRPIVFIKECELDNRFVIGIDDNRNKLIDACYSVKYINDELHYKRVKIYYNIDRENNEVVKQGCVCK